MSRYHVNDLKLFKKVEEIIYDESLDFDAWCDDASWAVSAYLKTLGIENAVVGDCPVLRDFGNGKTMAGSHTWIEFPDGTIFDTTITQFGKQSEIGWPGTELFAIVPPGHRFATNYGCRCESPYWHGKKRHR